ncbi:polysaccharide pyruvyl transferase family protein [Paracoccus methylarcula]|uniref:Polysaccharide pyruvyl transferase family protein n=1 Tax=Paracoccus methylarcula TaxID=72022 RepID=A0A422QUS7_9RHOB|nr:polysaccharide pyruvyl transferase family protein [Paracoccus methylarcula]RNF33740.1 polysaccharide pyruvyl transferase family protein [Paracoccus methylarcula]
MRILFHGPGTSSHLPEIRLPGTSGLTHAVTDTMAGLRSTHSLTSNRGNLIHGEAPSRIFACNRRQSAFANLGALHRQFGSRIGEVLSQRFDLLVLSAANFISAKKELVRLRDALNAIGNSVPFIVLGAGLQGQPILSEMHPSVQEILDIYNRRALIFGVRGLETEAWLHGNGFTNSRALGCPSMFVFPSSIMSIDGEDAIEKGKQANLITAGYLTVKGGRNYNRGVKLARAMRDLRGSYVFQDEFFAYADFFKKHGSFDDATCTGNRELLNDLLTREIGIPVDLQNYYYFSETSAWRQAARMHDAYIGDRFHGGIASLQAGRPGIFLCHDNRVAEMTDFYDLPRLTTDELISEGVENTFKKHLNKSAIHRQKETYLKRLNDFKEYMSKHNIQLLIPS